MKFYFLIFFAIIHFTLSAQDISYNRKMVDTLTSPAFWGRGYTNNGMQKAAAFLENEFKTLGLIPLKGKKYLQKFSISANTFPAAMELKINSNTLTAGIDYLITPESKGFKGTCYLQKFDSVSYGNKENKIVVSLVNKLTWSASQSVKDYTIIQINKNKIGYQPTILSANIDNVFKERFSLANVCAMVKGTQTPDSFLFITAHYDHLGGMGATTYFPGANDNASGVALLMSLAKYYATHPQKYSVGFILFAGEEIGLVGSKFYTENPIVPLNKIRFLTNTDLVGTGSDGITIVNATIFPKEFALMNKINDAEKYLIKINARGEAANSDHYWFTKKGVSSFFFYTMGGITAYHDVYDVAATLPLNEQADLKQLIIKFNEGLQK